MQVKGQFDSAFSGHIVKISIKDVKKSFLSYGLGLNLFRFGVGVSGRSSLKIEGKGDSEMTLLSAYITLKMQLLTPVSHLTLK